MTRKVTTRTPAGTVYTAEISMREVLPGEDSIHVHSINHMGKESLNMWFSRNAAGALLVTLGTLLGGATGEYTVETEE